MTNHAREAADKIWQLVAYGGARSETVPIIQAAIDAACEERDKKIAALQVEVKECLQLIAGEVVPIRRRSLLELSDLVE